jgi:DNA-binding NarL/FixJ family response regulator
MVIIIIIAGGSIAAICFLAAIIMALKRRSAGKESVTLSANFEDQLVVLRRDLEAAMQRANEQARRVAWLEAKVRASVPVPDDAIIDGPATPAEPSMTERRHRVLSLARRGLDVNSIATMLGEMHGEVELIIGLSKAA